jgi:putative SOS response-associated peptidase YedK
MCGRYGLTVDTSKLQERFETSNTLPDVQPRYNIAPTQELPVIVRNSPNSMALMQWGLIPSWSKEPKVSYSTINARAENLLKSSVYKKPFQSQRCLVPASGFYEWKQTSDGKQPYYIHVQDTDVFAFAGLYDIWRDKHGHELHSYTIITTTPNDLVAPIHNRMPVILRRDDEDAWLDQDADQARLLSLLRPYPADEMSAYRVSTWVNSPSNDTPQVLEPLEQAAE